MKITLYWIALNFITIYYIVLIKYHNQPSSEDIDYPVTRWVKLSLNLSLRFGTKLAELKFDPFLGQIEKEHSHKILNIHTKIVEL